MQDIAIDRRYRAKSAGCRIDAGCCGPPTDREFGRNGARDAKRPQPRHAVREVAQTLAEENPRLQRARSPDTDRLVAQAADAPGEARGDERLMRIVLRDLSLEREAG